MKIWMLAEQNWTFNIQDTKSKGHNLKYFHKHIHIMSETNLSFFPIWNIVNQKYKTVEII